MYAAAINRNVARSGAYLNGAFFRFSIIAISISALVCFGRRMPHSEMIMFLISAYFRARSVELHSWMREASNPSILLSLVICGLGCVYLASIYLCQIQILKSEDSYKYDRLIKLGSQYDCFPNNSLCLSLICWLRDPSDPYDFWHLLTEQT